jgi:hypothetical protein
MCAWEDFYFTLIGFGIGIPLPVDISKCLCYFMLIEMLM